MKITWVNYGHYLGINHVRLLKINSRLKLSTLSNFYIDRKHTMKRMKKIFLATIFILCTTSSCIGIIYGDFSNDNLSEDDLELIFQEIKFVNCEPLDFSNTNSLKDIKIDASDINNYKLEVEYKINGNYVNDFAMLVTIGTLGIFPFFHTTDATVEYLIQKGSVEILHEKESLNTIIFYGWILALSLEYFKSPDHLYINEGSGIEGALKDAIFQRLSKRIQKKLSEKKNPSKIKKFWFW